MFLVLFLSILLILSENWVQVDSPLEAASIPLKYRESIFRALLTCRNSCPNMQNVAFISTAIFQNHVLSSCGHA
jgi:hypothetical protein